MLRQLNEVLQARYHYRLLGTAVSRLHIAFARSKRMVARVLLLLTFVLHAATIRAPKQGITNPFATAQVGADAEPGRGKQHERGK